MLLENVLPSWVEATVPLLPLAAAIISYEKGKRKAAYVFEFIIAAWYLLVGAWIIGSIWVVLALVIIFVDRRRAKKKAAEERRVEEQVSNSAGTPDNLPH